MIFFSPDPMIDLTDGTPAQAKAPVFVDLTEETKLPTPQAIGKFAKEEEESKVDLNTSTGSLPGQYSKSCP